MTGIIIQLVFIALAIGALVWITIDDRRSQRLRQEADELAEREDEKTRSGTAAGRDLVD